MTTDRALTKAKKTSLHSIPEIGRHGTDAANTLQLEILQAYAQLNRSWLARVQSEAALWVDLGTKVASSRSLSEILEAHKRCVSHQMQMTVEDGQHLFDDCEKITRQICELVRSGTAAGNVDQRGA